MLGIYQGRKGRDSHRIHGQEADEDGCPFSQIIENAMESNFQG